MTEKLPPMHRRLSADEPDRVRKEAKRILNGLPVDHHAAEHRAEMVRAMFPWLQKQRRQAS